MKKIVFLCSNSNHLDLFNPILGKIKFEPSTEVILLTLGDFYYGTDESVLEQINLAHPEIRCENITIKKISAIKIIYHLDVFFRAGRMFSRIFDRDKPYTLVLGNDTGPVERTAIRIANKKSIHSILVQDGFVFIKEDKLINRYIIFNHIRNKFIEHVGKHIGFMPYGMGGCNTIATMGPFWASVFNARKIPPTEFINVIGSPKIERILLSRLALPFDDNNEFNFQSVTFFTTNFISGYDDIGEHNKQINGIINIAAMLFENDSSLKLIVKLHPAENREDYKKVLGYSNIEISTSRDLKSLVSRSWFCITNFSSIILTCAAYGRVCLLSSMYSSRKYTNLIKTLPGRKVNSTRELSVMLNKLASYKNYVELLKEMDVTLHEHVDVDNKISATERMVKLLLSRTKAL